ncbi:MAG: heavy metal-responsive transcriptional regulator [Burkholderiales bacterium RIFCSPLOWO2_02_FULL_57_36]|nr:MAG: heavy metal-responsive transcriptional regulator [Burkholderiales bacterium RIFCSPLOWO2_02_FULL_57_36]
MLTIGKIAADVGISTNALRFYEREGLIHPVSKSDSGYRLYDDAAAVRLHFIRHAQHCGFTLLEIRELLALREQDSACCSDVRRLVVEKKLQLEAKIKAMKAMSKALDILIADCPDAGWPANECPILGAFDQVNGGQKP